MKSRLGTWGIGFISGAVLFIGAGLVLAWTGPTSAPPNGNSSAPVNVGNTDQVKNGGLSLNALAVFGNAILQASSYLNWGTLSGSNGYGFRDNNGTMEYKNSGGSWQGFSSASTTGLALLFDSGWVTVNANTMTITSPVDLSNFQEVAVQAKGSASNSCFTSTSDVVAIPPTDVHYEDDYPNANRSQTMGWNTQVTSSSIIFRLWPDGYGINPPMIGSACKYYFAGDSKTLLRFTVYGPGQGSSGTSSSGTVLQGSMNGYCRYDSYSGANGCTTPGGTKAPATCIANTCGCAAGYTLVVLASFLNNGGSTSTYSCVKN